MAETTKEEIKRLERELRQTSIMASTVRSAQSQLISALTKHSDAISRSIITTIQNLKHDNDAIKLKTQSLELKKKQLEQARREQQQTEISIRNKQAEIDANRDRIRQLKYLGVLTLEETEELRKRKNQHKILVDQLNAYRTANKNATDAIEKFSNQVELKTEELKALNFQRLVDAVNGTAKVMDTLVQSVRKTQQQFGISAGSAAKLGFDNLQSSVKSFADTLKTGGAAGPGVTMEQIAQAQQDFQERFGGILTSEAATKMAQEAVRMGITTEQLAEARQVFLTQTAGDANKAQAQTDKFVSEFAKKGLSARTAMQEISKNSELLAKNGTRFSSQMIAALASAKKIGFELSKVSQFGDNLINDFEGFLEGQAELGAMGFGLDSSRLAEIAETGSDADLYNELRSQLAATGKDINKLRRSERLALESAFGMSISDMQKLAGETPEGGGEDTLDPAELQKNANEKLGNMVNLAEASVKALGVLGSALALSNLLLDTIAKNTGMGLLGRLRLPGRTRLARSRISRMSRNMRLPGRTRLLRSRLSGLTRRMAGSRFGRFTTAPARTVGKVGSSVLGRLGTGGVLAGIFGGIGGFRTARESGKGGFESAGAATVQGGLAAAGAALGAFGGPIGVMIGGFLGNTIGKAVNKYFPSLGANLGLVFKGMVSALDPLKKAFSGVWENIKKLGEPLSKIMNLFGGTTDKAKNLFPIMETIGNLLGTAILLPFNLLATTLGLASGAITALAQVLTGDFKGAWETLKSTFANSFAWIVEPITRAVDAVKGMFNGMVNWVIDIVNKLPGVDIEKIGVKKGDDVISQPGYGKRSLVTPSGVIALNNRDNIIAYADDLMGTTKLPLGAITGQFAKLGEFEQRANKVFAGLSESITGKFQGVKQSIGNIFGSSSEGLLGRFNKLKESGSGFVNSIKEGAFGKAKGLMDKFTGEGSLFSKAKGLMGGGGAGLKEKALGFASKIPGVGSLLSGDGAGLKEKALGFASKIPGVGSLLSGGVGGLKDKALGFASKIPGLSGITNKIPGLSSVSSLISGFKQGGLKGGLSSLAGAGTGKLIGGTLGTLIPIPGVGTALGAVGGDLIGKGISKLAQSKAVRNVAKYSGFGLAASGISKLAKSKVGKVMPLGLAAAGVGKLFGRKKKEDAVQVAPEMMKAPSTDLSMMLGSQAVQQPNTPEQKPVTVDTSGIENKLNNFINALQTIQINMDGTKVGKVLVNNAEAASSTGVFKVQSR